MVIDLNISIGEILLFGATFAAFLGAVIIGIKQNSINKNLLRLQNVVEFYVGFFTGKETRDDKEVVIPFLRIYNLGNIVAFLEYYIYNGRKYPVGNVLIPQNNMFPDFCYLINLPMNEENHVSFELYFEDALLRKWQVEGFADIINGKWVITNSRSKRI